MARLDAQAANRQQESFQPEVFIVCAASTLAPRTRFEHNHLRMPNAPFPIQPKVDPDFKRGHCVNKGMIFTGTQRCIGGRVAVPSGS